MEEKNDQQRIIDFRKIFKILRGRRKMFVNLWLIVFILSCVWILPQPRFYTCDVKLVPEMGLSNQGLASIASSFGLNIASSMKDDAILPFLYPDLFQSPEFIVSLYDIQIRTADGEIETDYYTYRKEYGKHNSLTYPFTKAKKWFFSIVSPKEQLVVMESGAEQMGNTAGVNPFCMSMEDDEMMMNVCNDIRCSVDKKTYVITISVRDQDRLVCALMADSVRIRLQNFITDYRTKKARTDVDYYSALKFDAEKKYNDAIIAYSRYTDSHSGMTHQSQMSEAERLKNELDIRLNAYNVINAQLSAAEAKVQDNTPAFTILNSATVPNRPAGPKRKLFVIGMLMLSTFVASVWLIRKELFGEF